MKKKLIWRLREQPTPESLKGLVNTNILTKDEAREILFSSETEEDRDKKSLESEIKFLRNLVEKLSKGNNSHVVEIIREVEKPYYRWDWHEPYRIWCSGDNKLLCSSSTTGNNNTHTITNFSDIKTF